MEEATKQLATQEQIKLPTNVLMNLKNTGESGSIKNHTLAELFLDDRTGYLAGEFREYWEIVDNEEQTKPIMRFRIEDFEVKKELRRKGIGKRLMRNLTAYCKASGVRYIDGGLISKEALLARVSVFGLQNLELKNTQRNSINLPLDQILQLYDEMDGTDEPFSIKCRVDLRKIDSSSWEMPNMTNEAYANEQPKKL